MRPVAVCRFQGASQLHEVLCELGPVCELVLGSVEDAGVRRLIPKSARRSRALSFATRRLLDGAESEPQLGGEWDIVLPDVHGSIVARLGANSIVATRIGLRTSPHRGGCDTYAGVRRSRGRRSSEMPRIGGGTDVRVA